jgi:hypothetical protein
MISTRDVIPDIFKPIGRLAERIVPGGILLAPWLAGKVIGLKLRVERPPELGGFEKLLANPCDVGLESGSLFLRFILQKCRQDLFMEPLVPKGRPSLGDHRNSWEQQEKERA